MRTANNLKRHELIGLHTRVIRARNSANVGVMGKIVDETQHTLVIRHGGKEKRVFKKCVELEIELGSEKVQLNGNDLEGRPWDRIKK